MMLKAAFWSLFICPILRKKTIKKDKNLHKSKKTLD